MQPSLTKLMYAQSSRLHTNRAYIHLKLLWDVQTQGPSHPWDAQN